MHNLGAIHTAVERLLGFESTKSRTVKCRTKARIIAGRRTIRNALLVCGYATTQPYWRMSLCSPAGHAKYRWKLALSVHTFMPAGLGVATCNTVKLLFTEQHSSRRNQTESVYNTDTREREGDGSLRPLFREQYSREGLQK